MLLYLISHLNYHTVNSKSSIALEHSTYHTRTELMITSSIFVQFKNYTSAYLICLWLALCVHYLYSQIYIHITTYGIVQCMIIE